MQPEARRMLDQIDVFLNRNDIASREVAAVITALRSCDNFSDISLKAETTCKIRAVAFPLSCKPNRWGPKVGREGQRNMATVSAGTDLSIIRIESDINNDHFYGHLILAAEALDIQVIR